MGRKSGAYKFEKRRKELEKKKKKEQKRLARLARKEAGDEGVVEEFIDGEGDGEESPDPGEALPADDPAAE